MKGRDKDRQNGPLATSGKQEQQTTETTASVSVSGIMSTQPQQQESSSKSNSNTTPPSQDPIYCLVSIGYEFELIRVVLPNDYTTHHWCKSLDEFVSSYKKNRRYSPGSLVDVPGYTQLDDYVYCHDSLPNPMHYLDHVSGTINSGELFQNRKYIYKSWRNTVKQSTTYVRPWEEYIEVDVSKLCEAAYAGDKDYFVSLIEEIYKNTPTKQWYHYDGPRVLRLINFHLVIPPGSTICHAPSILPMVMDDRNYVLYQRHKRYSTFIHEVLETVPLSRLWYIPTVIHCFGVQVPCCILLCNVITR